MIGQSVKQSIDMVWGAKSGSSGVLAASTDYALRHPLLTCQLSTLQIKLLLPKAGNADLRSVRVELVIEQDMSHSNKAACASCTHHCRKQFVSSVSPLHLIANLFDFFC